MKKGYERIWSNQKKKKGERKEKKENKYEFMRTQ